MQLTDTGVDTDTDVDVDVDVDQATDNTTVRNSRFEHGP